MYALAISTGHNASVVAIKDGHILGGYEEERFTGKKADSAFATQSILELIRRFDLPENTNIYVGHWFPDGFLKMESKYFSYEAINQAFPRARIHSLHKTFTHHDSHMEAARVFAGEDFANQYMVYVMDGFGTTAECYSIYSCSSRLGVRPIMLQRIYGYHLSIGLFYQYATAFCGMKMHNHEYKMLAYETHINEVDLDVEISDLDEHINWFSSMVWSAMILNQKKSNTLDDLAAAKQMVDDTLINFLKKFRHENSDKRTKRILVSYFAQRHTENIVRFLQLAHGAENLIVSGGVFYNVKINHLLCNMVSGKFCAYPLAGDQGAALGVYQHYEGNLRWPNNLFWGHRTVKRDELKGLPGIEIVDAAGMYQALSIELVRTGFVNVVRGAMEYGPRALCNTSTLALPYHHLGEVINQMNGRTNEMPFALVMTRRQAEDLFDDTQKVHKSLEYMIMARRFKPGAHRDLAAGAHYYPNIDTWTCRPQVTDDPLMVSLLNRYGPLINTSFNYHGVPIVRSTKDIIHTHMAEKEALPNSNFKTIIQEDITK